MCSTAMQTSQITAMWPMQGRWDALFLIATTKANMGIRVSSKDANAELHFAATDIMFTNPMRAVKYRDPIHVAFAPLSAMLFFRPCNQTRNEV